MIKQTVKSRLALALASVFLAFGAQEAKAIPSLQLGIAGGSYDTVTDTILSPGSSFALYAFLITDGDNSLTDTYFLSMAVTPKVSAPASLGSFTYNSTPVNVTADMTYGNPPLDSFFPDIGGHGIYDTYYKEVSFSFSGAQTTPLNTETDFLPLSGPGSGTGMYYQSFAIDTSSLASGYQIHFDLYNTNLKEKCKKGVCDWIADSTQFAPFSHDAQSTTTPIPEPETYAMLMAGLGLMAAVARRRKTSAQ